MRHEDEDIDYFTIGEMMSRNKTSTKMMKRQNPRVRDTDTSLGNNTYHQQPPLSYTWERYVKPGKNKTGQIYFSSYPALLKLLINILAEMLKLRFYHV